jgi:hypothetical protein
MDLVRRAVEIFFCPMGVTMLFLLGGTTLAL